jgi:hypothetical protein
MIRRISRVSAGLEQKPVPSVSSLGLELERPAVIPARPGKEAEEDVEHNGGSALAWLAGWLSVRRWVFTSVSCLSLMCRTEK